MKRYIIAFGVALLAVYSALADAQNHKTKILTQYLNTKSMLAAGYYQLDLTKVPKSINVVELRSKIEMEHETIQVNRLINKNRSKLETTGFVA